MSQEAKRHLVSEVAKIQQETAPHRNAKEAIRQQIIEHAQRNVAAYEAEANTVRPDAEHALQAIIYPWWSDFKNSSLYQDIVSALSEKVSFKLLLNDPISYYWPDITIRELRGKEPFALEAERVAKEKWNPQDAGTIAAQYAQPASHDTWTGSFYFSGLGNEYHKLAFEPWNDTRASWSFSVLVQQLHLSLDPKRASQDFFAKVNPAVYVEFSKQIASGRVWEVLEESLKAEVAGG